MQVVSVLDPAIDVKAMGYEKLNRYLETRDLELIRPFFKQGESPMVFHLREAPQSLWESFVEDGKNEQDRYKRALMCCLVNVENMHQRDGTRIEAGSFARPDRQLIEDATIGLFAPQYRLEIGRVAYEHSFFDLRMPAPFLLPPSLVVPLEQRMRASDPAAESTPNSPSAKPSETASQDSASTP